MPAVTAENATVTPTAIPMTATLAAAPTETTPAATAAVSATATTSAATASTVTQTLPVQIPHELQGRENCL